MKKFKKKFLLTGLALAVPLVGAIALACSEVSQDMQPNQPATPPATPPANPPADQSKQTDQSKSMETMSSSSDVGSLENLPMFIKLTK